MRKSVFFLGITIFTMSLSSCGQAGDNPGIGDKNTCVVTFNSNGGSNVPSQTVKKGDKVKKPDNPTKENFEFVNWTYQGEEWSFIGYIVTENMTLDANWSRTHYSVTFNTNGGSEVASQNVAIGGKATKPADPTKAGYLFVNWTYQGSEWNFNHSVSEDMIMVANWVEAFTVTFNSQGGTDIPSQQIAKGEKAIKPTNPTKTGYDFLYWTYEGAEWNFNSPVNKNITLSANWIQTFTVIFDSAGGSNVQSQTIRKGGKVDEPSIPTRMNYDFVSWEYNGVKWDFDQNTVNENITLIATWNYNGFEDGEFEITLSNNRSSVYLNEEVYLIVSGPTITSDVTFKYRSSNSSVATISSYGEIIAHSVGQTTITVIAQKNTSSRSQSFTLNVEEPELATTSDCSIPNSPQEKAEMIGALEKYALGNNLAGIPIAQNDKYVKFSERIKLATDRYIENYGFGLVEEGRIDSTKPSITETNPDYQNYLHIAVSSDVPPITSRFRTGVEKEFDLGKYITSSYWDKKMNETKDGYTWYPVLAKDKVIYDNREYDFNSPIPIYQNEEVKPGQELNETGLYNTWRIYVKTGSNSGIKYRYSGNSWNIDLDKRNVELEDYEFSYRLLLSYNLLLAHMANLGADIGFKYTKKSLAYTIVGADYYVDLIDSSGISDEAVASAWNKLKDDGLLGVKTGTDVINGDYVQVSITKNISRYDAMEMFSSRLLSPLPEEFINTIGEGNLATGIKRYGDFNTNLEVSNDHRDKILDYFICVGPYMIESWTKDQYVTVKKNNLWNEPDRFNFEGIKAVIVDNSYDSSKIYQRFMVGEIDTTSVPLKFLASEIDQPRVYLEKGSSIFKLCINSCSQEKWNGLFGRFCGQNAWECKPWMSNDNFLKGIFYSIDRKEFANDRGMRPSINFFPDSYLYDPENGKSYNDSEAHKNAVKDYEVYDSQGESLYGYSKDRAINYFMNAVKELVHNSELILGTEKNPTRIKINICWEHATDIKDYGDSLVTYITNAFNDSRVSGGKVRLEIQQDSRTSVDYYTDSLICGMFDLAIDLNFDDRSSYLDLMKTNDLDLSKSSCNHNYGPDTSVVNTNKPLIYYGKSWSFDALLATINISLVIDEGVITSVIGKSYLEYDISDGPNFANGRHFCVTFELSNLEGIQTSILGIRIYLFGYVAFDLDFTTVTSDNKITAIIDLPYDTAQEIQRQIIKDYKLDDPNMPGLWNDNPFTLEYYNRYWNVEAYSCSVATIESQAGNSALAIFQRLYVSKNEAVLR